MQQPTPTDSITRNHDVRPIAAEETRPLRHAVLRPHQPPAATAYPGDAAPETFHAGAFSDGELVGIASVYHESPPGAAEPGAWRLRGMAVLERARGNGHGEALIKTCVAYIRDRGGTYLWCNARTSAVPFYQKQGFQTLGEEYEAPGLGPHFFMQRSL